MPKIYIVKWGFTGVYIIFIIFDLNILFIKNFYTATKIVMYTYLLTYFPANSYGMAYRLLDYTNTYDQADIEDMLGRKYDFALENKNGITNAILSPFKGIVVTWSITDGTLASDFQIFKLSFEIAATGAVPCGGRKLFPFITQNSMYGNKLRVCYHQCTRQICGTRGCSDGSLEPPLRPNYFIFIMSFCLKQDGHF